MSNKSSNDGSFHSSVPISHDRVTVSWHKQSQQLSVTQPSLILLFVPIVFPLWHVSMSPVLKKGFSQKQGPVLCFSPQVLFHMQLIIHNLSLKLEHPDCFEVFWSFLQQYSDGGYFMATLCLITCIREVFQSVIKFKMQLSASLNSLWYPSNKQHCQSSPNARYLALSCPLLLKGQNWPHTLSTADKWLLLNADLGSDYPRQPRL